MVTCVLVHRFSQSASFCSPARASSRISDLSRSKYTSVISRVSSSSDLRAKISSSLGARGGAGAGAGGGGGVAGGGGAGVTAGGSGANLDLLGRFGTAYGFDLSAVGLHIAHESGRTRIARASVTAAPFPSNFFDLVTSFDVLYSLDDADERASVAEMYRLTRRGG